MGILKPTRASREIRVLTKHLSYNCALYIAVGSTQKIQQFMWVYDAASNKIVTKSVTFVSATLLYSLTSKLQSLYEAARAHRRYYIQHSVNKVYFL